MSPPPPPGSVQPPIDSASAQLLPPDQTPNPEYARLYGAYQSAYGGIDDLRKALDPAARTLGGTDAWLGPEARRWGAELDEHRQKLRRAADKILWDIYSALVRTDRVVTRG